VHLREHDRHLDQQAALVEARRAITEVYRYLLHRCGSATLAEDLTSESVLAAVDRLLAGDVDSISVPYVIGVARHKLVDHWRRHERERRHLELHTRRVDDMSNDIVFEPGRTAGVLAKLSPMQRAALTLRYLDDLSVPAVARHLGRSVESTETLLTRAKRAFREKYQETDDE
jgi:RNA polymerase sigma-70 factor (ECF subfamily)